MAVAFDANMTAGNGPSGADQNISSATGNSVTGPAVTASGTLLVATLSMLTATGAAPAGVAVTWNGVAMNMALHGSSINGLNQVDSYIFTLVNPASGAKALVATWTNSADCYMGCCSFKGTDTTVGYTSADNTTATNASAISVPTTASGATLALFTCNGAIPVMNQTGIWADDPFGPGGGASYALGGSGSNSHTFTATPAGIIQSLAGIHIIASGGGSGTTISPVQGAITAVGNTPTVTPAQSTVITPIVARDHRILVPSRRIFLPTFRRAA